MPPGKRLVVISEEWQTAQTAIELSDQLHLAGLRDHAELLWNANHTYGLERVDWPRLVYTNRITTVSRFMRAELLRFGIDAEVQQNGIPRRLLRPVETPKRSACAKRPAATWSSSKWRAGRRTKAGRHHSRQWRRCAPRAMT